MFSALLTILGLTIFEAVSSLDNAIINAQVLSTMKEKARRWFLTWGILLAVFGVRGILPLVIVWAANPTLGPIGAITATFSSDPHARAAIEQSAPILLAGGGVFLIFLFFHWLFLEEKRYGFIHERHFHRYSTWFYAVVSLFLTVVVWIALHTNHMIAFGAVVGSTVFFITHGFKEQAEKKEKELLAGNEARSDLSKILYLEAIDASFSIDGVLGAFAFTFSIPLILLGNGLGAIIVRQMTIGNISRIKRYPFLKNGAMYSILVLGSIMVAHAFGSPIPEWVSPICTIVIIGYFVWRAIRADASVSQEEPAR
jgi:hypothetical protein